jgi:hypothetical protein
MSNNVVQELANIITDANGPGNQTTALSPAIAAKQLALSLYMAAGATDDAKPIPKPAGTGANLILYKFPAGENGEGGETAFLTQDQIDAFNSLISTGPVKTVRRRVLLQALVNLIEDVNLAVAQNAQGSISDTDLLARLKTPGTTNTVTIGAPPPPPGGPQASNTVLNDGRINWPYAVGPKIPFEEYLNYFDHDKVAGYLTSDQIAVIKKWEPASKKTTQDNTDCEGDVRTGDDSQPIGCCDGTLGVAQNMCLPPAQWTKGSVCP